MGKIAWDIAGKVLALIMCMSCQTCALEKDLCRVNSDLNRDDVLEERVEESRYLRGKEERKEEREGGRGKMGGRESGAEKLGGSVRICWKDSLCQKVVKSLMIFVILVIHSFF